MPSRARFFSLLLLWPAWPARAACPDAYNAIIAEALSGYEVELNCDQIRNAAMQLPIRTRDTGADSFAFAGEEDLRGELRDKHGLFIPADRVVLGTLERKSPLGPKMMLVFALHAPRRLSALIALAKSDNEVPREQIARTLGEGVWYDRVGFFVASERGYYQQDGKWLPMRGGGLWGRHGGEPEGTRICLPCTGWICPPEPVACFSDFNDNQLEEVHLTDDCRAGPCGLAVVEPRRKSAPKVLLNAQLDAAEWRRVQEGWALVRKPPCKEGSFCSDSGESLGNPRCERPEVLVIRRGAEQAESSEAARDRIFPIRRKPWPLGCLREKGPVELVYNDADGFVLYEK